MADVLLADARREAIAAMVVRQGFLRVSDASAYFRVSEVTIRADLHALESTGVITRVHGGAMPRSAVRESSFERSLERETTAKRAIGRAAARMVTSGSSILLDVGTTALAVASALVERTELSDVVVVTNGLATALALEPAMSRMTVVVTGGTLRPLQHSLVDPGVSSSLDNLHVDLAFIGCNGVSVQSGVTNVNVPEAEVKRRMLRSCSRAVAIADASKLGKRTLGIVGVLSDFDSVITAGIVNESRIGELRNAGLRVIIAS